MPVHNAAWPQGTPCWIDCQVNDPVKAGRFYGELFDWVLQDGGPDAGGYLMASKDGAAAAGIGPKPSALAAMPSGWTTYIAVDDADASAAAVRRAGGKLVLETFDVMEFGRMFVAEDPGGAIFAVWQARAHNGAALHNEHGGYAWNELHTREYDRSKAFYRDVFGYRYTEYDFGDTAYVAFTPPGRTEVVGGISDDSAVAKAASSYWLTWFQYDDVDAGAKKALGLGGSVLQAAADSPVGRTALIAAPQGEVFGIIDPSKRVGELPNPN
ncbi:VOC family protein [Nocardia arthritidis]|uniref:VOC family protein n=1 Tax=Nocardia arthritidis TaxID=228602 RepID=A0A6G9YS49_9NOCA|nr:VOC family protein [Nocardia arthritidis]QIS15836.1 VOC family protein [Nocardia arthritidis]